MARTLPQIYAQIIAEKQAQTALSDYLPGNDSVPTLLDDITSASKVAKWRLFSFIIAFAHFLLEQMFDLFKAEVNALVAAQKFGTLPWYVSISKLWQFGDPLVYVGDYPGYDTIDLTKRLVVQASANENSGIVFLKVAKAVGTGLGPLTITELESLEGYMSKMKPAGIYLGISSLNGDVLAVNVTIEFQAELDPAAVRLEVNAAITAYLAALPFDGKFRIIELVDAIQSVPGIVDVVVVSATMTSGIAVTTVTQVYETRAGYAVYNAAGSTLNLLPV